MYSGFDVSHSLRLVAWVSFFSYWCSVLLRKTASDVLACPSAFSTNSFPPFHRALLAPWQKVGSSSSERRSSLIFSSSSLRHVVSCMTAKCLYNFFMSESRGDPLCVEKFLPLYGVLFWPTPANSVAKSVYVRDLPRKVCEESIVSVFSTYAKVSSVNSAITKTFPRFPLLPVLF